MGDYDIHPDEQMPQRDRVGRWADKAACAGLTLTMHPTTEQNRHHRSRLEDEAIAICLTCPVKYECRKHALDNDERWGVWGGLTSSERWAISKGHRRVCQSCGDTFTTTGRNRRRYCSHRCRLDARNAQLRRKTAQANGAA